MSEHGITASNILRSLPIALQGDPSVMALSQATAEELAKMPAKIDLSRLYAAIDRLPEAVLDILAYDFKIDWWDGDYSLEEKRRVFRDSFLVHRRLGTKWAVETAISAIYPRTKVLEWFEYGGEPYHFRLDINVTNDTIGSGKQRRVLERLNYYKNLRSHNDGITYFVEAEPAVAKAVPVSVGRSESVRSGLSLDVPKLTPTVVLYTGGTASLSEYVTTVMPLHVPVLSSVVTARTGIATTFFDSAQTVLDLPVAGVKTTLRTGVTLGSVERFESNLNLNEVI